MEKLDDFTRYNLLNNPWTPPPGYNFPVSLHAKRHGEQERSERRSVQVSHFTNYPWLVFSEEKQGLFCKFCAVFCYSKLSGGQKTVPLKKLVTEPLQKYAKLSGKDGDLEKHRANKYHRDAEIDGNAFLKAYKNPEHSIINIISEERKKQIMSNRARLVPIIKTIMFHGRQNIPLRGHRDDGSLLEDSEDLLHNDGNFRASLRFRIDSGDMDLENHLKTCKGNATYIGKNTANELVTCCGQEILRVIQERVHAARYFSVIFDETTDMSHTSQLTVCLRYVYDGQIHEDFVGFLDLHHHNYSGVEEEPKITGKILGQSVLFQLKQMNLDTKYCIGVGCDGCSVNISESRGAVSEIQTEAIYSILCSCKNHALNLAISRSSKVQSVRNAFGVINEVVSFFKASSKRNKTIVDILGHQMTGNCETRWVERHKAIVTFRDDLPDIAKALEKVSKWDDYKTATKGKCLLLSICNCEFILTVYSLSDVLSATYILSRYLQNETVDVFQAKKKVDQTFEVLKDKRMNSHKIFSGIFAKAKKIMEEMDIPIHIPRAANRQKNRANYPATNDEDDIIAYWEKIIYIPILDYVNTDIKDRFAGESIECFKLNTLIPAVFMEIKNSDSLESMLEKICDKYAPLLKKNKSTMLSELDNEITFLKKSPEFNDMKSMKTAMDLYMKCDENDYPLLKILYQILVTLPISAATAERSFSDLRRLKTWLRTRMNEDRLTGLALLYIHRNININTDNAINRFASQKTRRCEFLL